MSSAERSPVTEKILGDWQSLLRRFKEKLAQRLWALPTVSEAEKELVFKEYLSDLDTFEREISAFYDEMLSVDKVAKDENDLLRSLLGVPGDELKTRNLAMNHDLHAAKERADELEQQLSEATRQLSETRDENAILRKRLRELEGRTDDIRADQMKTRQRDIEFFSDSQENLKNQFKDLESRLSNLRELFNQNNKKMLVDRQDEISVLQKKLLQEMEAALRQKQELSWTEEEMFAKGVAHKVRAALVSVQGQLFLTLERLGLLDPKSKEEDFWKARWHLLVAGAGELSTNFKAVEGQLQEVTRTLDDYLHLTRRRDLIKESVSLKELVQAEVAEVYVDRRPTLSLEFLPDDPLPDVTGDKELMRFIVRTLMRNALEALPNETGRVVVALKNRSQEGKVQILVRDSGSGIPPHLSPRLFQPFFTTKNGRQGLNLSRAKRYAELHGGSLELVATGPDGTTFVVNLPLKGGK